MPLVRLSPETQRRLELLFRTQDRSEATRLLVEECGTNLPFLQNLDEHGLERYRFAALKLSGGKLERLQQAVTLAKADWRDLLVAAQFDHDPRAHEFWTPG